MFLTSDAFANLAGTVASTPAPHTADDVAHHLESDAPTAGAADISSARPKSYGYYLAPFSWVGYSLLSLVTMATRMAWSKEPMTHSPSLSGLQSKQQMG
mmetsp:Transcript_31582/g.89687  ORF Transcript_31582/g.89687 Transcript_31582/m.89687 type:complete len:99 (-) Transcript_31582:1171-1467(-)